MFIKCVNWVIKMCSFLCDQKAQSKHTSLTRNYDVSWMPKGVYARFICQNEIWLCNIDLRNIIQVDNNKVIDENYIVKKQ